MARKLRPGMRIVTKHDNPDFHGFQATLVSQEGTCWWIEIDHIPPGHKLEKQLYSGLTGWSRDFLFPAEPETPFEKSVREYIDAELA